jgi:hypothetical protein
MSGAILRTARGLSYLPYADGCDPQQLRGVPVLLDHRMEADAVVGITECGWVEHRLLNVIVRLVPTERAKQAWVAIEAGALRGLSFTVNPLDAFERDGVVHVPRWSPTELSIVPLGWDEGATIASTQDREAILERMVRDVEEAQRSHAALAVKVGSGRIAAAERIATALAIDFGLGREKARESARQFVIDTDPDVAAALAAASPTPDGGA